MKVTQNITVVRVVFFFLNLLKIPKAERRDMIGQKKDYDPKMDVPGRVVNGNLRCSFIKIIFSIFLFPI